MLNAAVNDEQKADHANSLSLLLTRAGCPIARWVGDLALAERYIDLLFDCATRHGLAVTQAFAKAFRGILFIERGDLRNGVPMLREGFGDFGAAVAGYRVLSFLGDLAEALGRAGQVAE